MNRGACQILRDLTAGGPIAPGTVVRWYNFGYPVGNVSRNYLVLKYDHDTKEILLVERDGAVSDREPAMHIVRPTLRKIVVSGHSGGCISIQSMLSGETLLTFPYAAYEKVTWGAFEDECRDRLGLPLGRLVVMPPELNTDEMTEWQRSPKMRSQVRSVMKVVKSQSQTGINIYT
jgi:hypothetical protein